MWQTFFRVCNFLCGFIPNPARRAHIRKIKLYDWAKKYAALRHACPEMRFRHVKMIKGGWNIGFIVDGKYVFKIRKFFDDESHPVKKIVREKRITDAFEHISPLKIPKIDIVESDGYTFYRYNFIPGRNMNTFSTRTLRKYEKQWCKQIAHFIYTVHNARPDGIDDLRDRDGDGWNQNDICNNLIVNPKTMKIIGLIDWEYAGWGTLETEFENCVHFSQKLRGSTFKQTIRAEYEKLATKKKY
jgi:aminoglycoside phosphotransferase (APT) family kinase protein